MKPKKILSGLLCGAVAAVTLAAFAGCADEKQAGKFYTLQEAYNNNYITGEDLRSIADIYNGYSVCLQRLDVKTESAIKQTVVYDLKNEPASPKPQATADDVSIVDYYGEYNECRVVTIDSVYWEYPAEGVDRFKIIGPVSFHITTHLQTLVWVPVGAFDGSNEGQPSEIKGTFYTLSGAFDGALITEADIRELSYRRWRNVYVVSDDETDWQCSENWIELDYTPSGEEDGLGESVKTDILGTYYVINRNSFFDKDGNKKGGVEDLVLLYYGQYNGLYAVMIESALWSYPADVWVERYGNTVLYITRCQIYFFKPAD